jgi:hypothetical protein
MKCCLAGSVGGGLVFVDVADDDLTVTGQSPTAKSDFGWK